METTFGSLRISDGLKSIGHGFCSSAGCGDNALIARNVRKLYLGAATASRKLSAV
jgi:hypothetical protein